jgi:hypothetical protein
MSLPVPTVGVDPGPDYANNINAALALLDGHDHSSGKGTQITPAGMSINSDLTMGNNSLTNIKALALTAQSSVTTAAAIYVSGVDLYFNDGSGNQIRMTQGGSISGATGSISGLTSPASASYVSASSKFVFQSAVNTAADLDGRSLLLRNATASSKALTLSPPNAMAADYSIVMPALPASQKILTLDASGNMAASYTVDGTSIAISSNVIGIAALGVNTAQLAASAVTTAKVADGAITQVKQGARPWGVSAGINLSVGQNVQATGTGPTVTTTGRPVLVFFSGIVYGWGAVYLLRDGNIFYTADGTSFGTQSFSSNIAVDSGASAGSHTYSVRVGAVNDPSAGMEAHGFLTAIEL